MKQFFTFLLLIPVLIANAAPGDTIRVTTHDDVFIETNPAVGSTDYFGWGNFPTVPVHKVLMNLSFRCPAGEDCGEWDYLNYIYLKRAGGVEGDTLDIELARYITPYGLYYSSTWKGEWTLDVTDFAGLLRDSVEIQYRHTGYETNVGRGWVIDLSFDFIEGTPIRNFEKVNKLWNGNYSYGNSANPINNQLTPKEVTLGANTRSVRSYIVQTGHSFGDIENCAEFCPKERTMKMDGSTYLQKLVWRDQCGENPNFPQAGTWLYDRSGWCPGDIAYPDFTDLTVEPSSTHTFTCEMQNYVNQGGSSPNYVIESFLFEYGAPNFNVDASVEDILAPSTKYYHTRINPICGSPKILIRNNGSAELISLVIEYGDKNGPKSSYTWTGNLGFSKSVEVELPPTVQWNESGTFEVVLSNPNGTTDEYALNNRMESIYEAPLELPETFVVNLRTNTFGNESYWKIEDKNGNIVADRSNMAGNTEYKDTLTLPWGCYSFVLEDSDEDGLGWWANDDGTGYVRIRKAVGSGFLKFWGTDFGSFIREDFTIGGALNTPEAGTIPSRAIIYPNPAGETATLDIQLEQPAIVTLRVYATDGRLVDERNFGKTDFVQENILKSEYPAGLYLADIQAGSFRKTIRWVVK